MQIRRENDITYTMVGSPFLDRLEPLFQKAGFEYTLLFGDDIPAELPREFYLGKIRMTCAVCCVKSYMNSEDVHQLMLQLWSPSRYGEVEA